LAGAPAQVDLRAEVKVLLGDLLLGVAVGVGDHKASRGGVGDGGGGDQAYRLALLLCQGEDGGQLAPVGVDGQTSVDRLDSGAPGIAGCAGLGDEAGQAVGVLQPAHTCGQEALEGQRLPQHPPRVKLRDGVIFPAHPVVGKENQVTGPGQDARLVG
jgi:hypothetical protein